MIKFSSAKDTKEVSLTIYNGGFGAVKEKRALELSGAEEEVVYSDVAQGIETNSLIVEGLSVLEFNYDYDLVGREKLLQKYIDKEVFLRDRKTGEKKSCRLLSCGQGESVLEDNKTGEIYIDTSDEIILPSLPSGLIVKPALVWKVAPEKCNEAKISYLSKGFSWIADYVAELKEGTLSLSGWAEIENTSGATFENASIKLIAGDVKRLEDDEMYVDECMVMGRSLPAPQAVEKSFADYHMYTLLNKSTLKNNQTKQIAIINGDSVPYNRYYVIYEDEDKTDVVIEFQNNKQSGLGVALPKGRIKLYQEDNNDSALEFIGEDAIDHTPANEAVALTIGSAFDIAYTYEQIEKKKSQGYEYFKYHCSIRNHKEEEAEVRFEHNIWGCWKMESSTHDYIKKNSDTIKYSVKVPAGGKTDVEFAYKVDLMVDVRVRR